MVEINFIDSNFFCNEINVVIVLIAETDKKLLSSYVVNRTDYTLSQDFREWVINNINIDNIDELSNKIIEKRLDASYDEDLVDDITEKYLNSLND